MALSKQELKEVFKIVNSIKNSGMNPWGNLKRSKEMRMTNPRSKKSKIFNREDVSESPTEEKFKKKS